MEEIACKKVPCSAGVPLRRRLGLLGKWQQGAKSLLQPYSVWENKTCWPPQFLDQGKAAPHCPGPPFTVTKPSPCEEGRPLLLGRELSVNSQEGRTGSILLRHQCDEQTFWGIGWRKPIILGSFIKSPALLVSCLLWGTCLVGRGHAGEGARGLSRGPIIPTEPWLVLNTGELTTKGSWPHYCPAFSWLLELPRLATFFFFSGALPDTGGPELSEAHSKNSQVSNLTGHWRIQGAPGPYGELCDMLPVVIEVFHPNQKNLKVLSLAHLEAASLTLQGWLLKCTFPGLAFSQS